MKLISYVVAVAAGVWIVDKLRARELTVTGIQENGQQKYLISVPKPNLRGNITKVVEIIDMK